MRPEADALREDMPGLQMMVAAGREPLAALFGVSMLVAAPGYLALGWLQVELALVALLIGYHAWCYRLMIALRDGKNRRSQRWLRLFNEAPALLLIAIVVLAIVKPF